MEIELMGPNDAQMGGGRPVLGMRFVILPKDMAQFERDVSKVGQKQ